MIKRAVVVLTLATPLVGCVGAPAAVATLSPTLAEQQSSPTSVATPTATAIATVAPLPSPGATGATAPAATAAATSAPATPSVTQPEPHVAAHVFPVRPIEGNVSYGRTHHDYPATDIFCPIGSQFVAPIGGVIDYVSTEDIWEPATDRPQDRGGLSVALVGDDGLRYYGSHLSQVARGIVPGKRVNAGQLLGLTGNSGNARSTPPHLHFGISRPTTPDDWQVRRGEISPYQYLRAWQRGEDLTPEK